MDSVDTSNDIAIIGMACRYPGARDLSAFWDLISGGKEGVSHFSEDELLAAGVAPAELQNPNYVRSYGWIEGIENFDAAFFGYTPREAQLMDPQHRLFLQHCWHAFEHSGYDPAAVDGPVAVYAGAGQNTYRLNNLISNPALLRDAGGVQTTLGNDADFLTTRVSYKLGLTGPSLDVQTACSTSLIATHLAVQSLLSGESDMALAGGVSIVTTRKQGYQYIQGGTNSPDGHTRTFDARAQGMVGGDGVGVLLLKRLDDALADRDTIYAVIKGTAANNDGSLKVGFTAPAVEGQARVIAEAQAVAGIGPEDIDYVELHGTATPLGDAVEYAALQKVFGGQGLPRGSVLVGSAKSNIGHTNTAAGAAGLIKTALSLKNRVIPPSLFFEEPNPAFTLKGSPIAVNTRLRAWESRRPPRRAGVSAFGMGGTNAHAILEEPLEQAPAPGSRPFEIITASARSAARLDELASNLAAALAGEDAPALNEAAFTLHSGRRDHARRRFTSAASSAEASAALPAADGAHVFDGTAGEHPPPLALLFPGQGSQYPGMLRGIRDSEPVFEAALQQAAALFDGHLDRPLLGVIYPENNADAPLLKETRYTQPALFAVEYALAELVKSWGLRPAALLGHSIGEFAAACLAGVFSLEDACRVVAERGRLMGDCEPGAMLAVPLREDKVLGYLDPDAGLAAVNEPGSCVVSGTFDSIRRLEEVLAREEIPARRLHTSHAFHSRLMEPAMTPFRAVLESITLSPPQIPVISNLTGRPLTPEQAGDPGYWVRQMRSPVRFAGGLAALFETPDILLLEAGPGTTLSSLARRSPGAPDGRRILPLSRHPKDPAGDARLLAEALGHLWLNSAGIDWSAYHRGENNHRVPLPGYPFAETRHWIEAGVPAESDRGLEKNPDLSAWFYAPSWKRTPSLRPASGPQRRTWLLFTDRSGMGERLAGQLRASGEPVCTARAGAAFSEDGTAFTLRPGEEADYRDMLSSIRPADDAPLHVVHAWGVDPLGEDAGRGLETGFYSLLYLAKALGARQAPARISVLTTGLHEVTGSEPLEPLKALLTGPVRVIPVEYRHIECQAIDLDEVNSSSLPDRLLDEMRAAPPAHTERFSAYRGGHRWVQSFEPFPAAPAAGRPAALRDGGVVLITGGFGGIGQTLAAYLARTVQARLVLTARRPVPPDDPRVRELEAAGAEVLALQADAADPEQMQAVFETIWSRFGALHGVVHAAGVAGGGAIALKDADAAGQVLRTKVQGTLLLDRLSAGHELDFFAVCSSLASTLGGYGQVDYTAANAFLDHFCTRRAQEGLKAIAIDWDTWGESGMAVDTPVPRELEAARDASLALGITDAEGSEVFARTLDLGLPHVMISTSDFRRRFQEQTHVAGAAESSPVETGASLDRDEISSDFAAAETETQRRVASVWQLMFGIDSIGVHDDFFQLGGHSLLATQILNKLHKEFEGLELSMRDLFDRPTIAGLAARIEEQAGDGAAGGSTFMERFGNITGQDEKRLYLEGYFRDAADPGLDGGLRTADLIWRLKRDFDLRVYPHEIEKRPSAPDLAGFILDLLEPRPGEKSAGALELPLKVHEQPSPLPEKNPAMGFILSAPRSGSTLLRLMLNAHPALYAPPELALLAYDDMASWLAAQSATFAIDGLSLALQGLGREDAQETVQAWVREGTNIPAAYRRLQAAAGERTLVDKTPGYAMQPQILARAEAWFDRPWYIHLLRHPLPVIDSFARNRMHVVLGLDAADPYALGEKVWLDWNRNIGAFLESVDPERCLVLAFEDLVRAPGKTMEKVCRFLDLPPHPGMAEPYRQRQVLAGPGDPDILLHDSIDPSMADSWRAIAGPVQLAAEARALAARYGYSLDPAANGPPDIDALSDAEVDAMLAELLDEDAGESD